MTTLSITPQPLELNLAITLDSVPELALEVHASPQPQMTLDVLAGTPGPTTDLTPLLDRLESISDALPVDLDPVLASFAPLATSTDLANATDAVLARLDALPAPDVSAAVAPLATTEQLAGTETRTLRAITDLSTLQAAIVSTLAPQPGEGKRFMRGSIPEGWAEVAETGVAATPTLSTWLPFTAANSGTGTSSIFVYVEEGAETGLWRFTPGSISASTGYQRFDLDTGLPIGLRYNLPTPMSARSFPFAVGIGKYIYIGAFTNMSNTGSTNFYRFNTETGAHEALAAFPRGIGQADGVILNDGRIFVSAVQVTGTPQTAAACAFWVYDPLTNQAPVEVVVSLPLAQYASQFYGEGLALLRTGQVLLVDRVVTANSTKQSVQLLVHPNNSVDVGPALDTNSLNNSMHCLLETDSGVHLFSPASGAVQRTLGENTTGWTAPALSLAYPNPSAIATPNGAARSIRLPQGGWLTTCLNSSGTGNHALLCPGLQARGEVLVDTYKL